MQNMVEKSSENIPRCDFTSLEVFTEFEEIRKKQRKLYAKLFETELKIKEHSDIAGILRDLRNPQRKCYYQMSGILIESNVETVLPVLCKEKDKMDTRLEEIQRSIRQCTEDLTEFQETHIIKEERMENFLDKILNAESCIH